MATYLNIYHYRGDSYDAYVSITNYTPASNDVIKFGIKKTPNDKKCLIEKTIDPSDMHLFLTSEETQILPERCVYDIQITYQDTDGVSYTDTFVYGQFIVIKDVVQ